MTNNNVYAVILAGGGGTRLWPKSRNATPKQFLKLTSDQTMMQVTADRITRIIPWENIIVVTNEIYSEDVKKQLPKVPVNQIISEPERKETALAMLVGALYAKKLNPDAVVINLASDHVVLKADEFEKVMSTAAQVAEDKEYLVSVGITPSNPNTGLGYIKRGKQIKVVNDLPVYSVEEFKEKPNSETAEKYVDSGEYYWNANNYVWSSEAIDLAFKKYKPETYELTRKLIDSPIEDFHSLLKEVYEHAEKISIDYAISEQANNLVVIPGDFGWDDVGDWKVVAQLNDSNGDGNVVIGDGQRIPTLAIDSTDNLIHADKKLVAMVGVNDMIVVDTDEILMIVPKDRSQEVKKLVEKLKEENKKQYL